MTAYNFKRRFAPLVRDGVKRQTIRVRRRDGRDAKPGRMLQLYVGLRTKGRELLLEAVCRDVKTVRIDRRFAHDIELDDRPLTRVDAEAFARADGFSCFDELLEWFTIEQGRELPFFGLVIYW